MAVSGGEGALRVEQGKNLILLPAWPVESANVRGERWERRLGTRKTTWLSFIWRGQEWTREGIQIMNRKRR